MEILFYSIIALSTVFASFIHGSDFLTKGLVVVVHVIVFYTGFYFLIDQNLIHAIFSLIPILGYWTIARSGNIAQAELDCIRNPSSDNIKNVMSEYIPFFSYVSTFIMLHSIFNQNIYFGLIIPTFIVLSCVSIYLTLKTFNHTTSIGKRLKKKEDASWKKYGHGDRVIDNRSYQEIFIGLLPCGVGISMVSYVIVELIKKLIG